MEFEPRVSLRDFIDSMDVFSDEHHPYLNRRSGELVTITDEEISLAEQGLEPQAYPEWQIEIIEKTKEVLESEEYLPLPSRFDIHEYAIMERFCSSIEDEPLREELLDQIRGPGAFRRFKDALHRHNVADNWYSYREDTLAEIAVGWLTAHRIRYHNDLGQDKRGA